MSVRARVATLWRTGRRLSAGQGRGSGRGHVMACAVCGAPASDWLYDSYVSDGTPVIDGYAVCTLHEEARESRAG